MLTYCSLYAHFFVITTLENPDIVVTETIVLGVFAGISLLVTIIDIRWKMIPDLLVVPGFLGSSAVRIVDDPRTGVGYLLTGIVMIGVLGAVWFFSGGKMGLGDVKLAGYVGTVLGSHRIVVAIFFTGVISLVVCLPLIALRKLDWSTRVAFGPFLLAGSWIAIWVHALAPTLPFPGGA